MTRDEVDLVTVGCSVYDKAPDCDPDEAERIRGGVVWGTDRRVDAETGELVDVFLVAERWPRWKQRVRFDRILAADVRQWNLPQPAVIKSLIASAAEQVAAHGKAIGTDELACVELQHRLVAVL
jgi:hypothetical protein